MMSKMCAESVEMLSAFFIENGKSFVALLTSVSGQKIAFVGFTGADKTTSFTPVKQSLTE